jgi:hypothetical protein
MHSSRQKVFLLRCVWIQYNNSINHICASIWMVLVVYISFCSSQFNCRFCAVCLLWYIWSTSRSSSKWIFCSIAGKKNLVNLEALGERYGLSSEGPSHRAMPDVEALCNILPKITLDLKLTCDDLTNEAMRFSDVRKASWIWVSDVLVVLVINIFDISFSWLLLQMV